jgi:hypothetical protein
MGAKVGKKIHLCGFVPKHHGKQPVIELFFRGFVALVQNSQLFISDATQIECNFGAGQDYV